MTVLLDGQGADELFAGYPGLEPLIARSTGLPAIARALRAAPADTLRGLVAGRVPAALGERARRHAAAPYATPDAAERASRRPPPGVEWLDAGSTRIQGELLRQCFASSLPALLRYADRDSMAHSRARCACRFSTAVSRSSPSRFRRPS